MKINEEERLSIIEEVTLTLGQILLTYRELTEGLLDQTRLNHSKDKIETLKRELEDERDQQDKIRRSQRRRKELEKIRDQHRSEVSQTNEGKGSTTPILNGRGKVVGYLVIIGPSHRQILDAKGRLVAREISGRTYDRHGIYRGKGLQGLRVLGQTDPKSN